MTAAPIRKGRAAWLAAPALAFAGLRWDGPPAQDGAPPRPPPPPSPAEARAERIERERVALAAEAGRIEAFGREPEFRAALERLVEPFREVTDEPKRWAPVARGFASITTAESWLRWSSPAPGRELPVALDFGLELHPSAAIVDLARQLNGHGVEFLLAVFPNRLELDPAAIDPAFLATGERPDGGGEATPPAPFRGMVGPTTRFLLALCEAGVEVVNLAPVFAAALEADTPEGCSRELFLLGNKHWTPRAAELAAEAIAARIREMPWFTPGPATEGEHFSLKPRVIDVGSPGTGQAEGAPKERVALDMVRPLKPLSRGECRESPIVLLGDSYAKFYSDHDAGIGAHLRRFTGWPIDEITPMGGAEKQCREALARRRDGLRGKQVVIWLMQDEVLRPGREFVPIDVLGS